ncbi:MAG: type III pantothenate kinase [Thiohalospira sp.]
MDWVVDAGNTHLRWAGARGGRILWQAALPDAGPKALTAAWSCAPPPARIVVATVAGPRTRETIARAARDSGQREPEFLVSPAAGWGVRNGYREPANLGIDRFAALVAARHRHPAGALVVDVGTAVTLDLLVGGEHRGGYILPGPALMGEALTTGTAGVAAAQPDPAEAPGRDTATGVGRGIAHALVGAVAEVRAHLAGQGLSGVPCILTGGGAALVAQRIAPPRIQLPGLVLEGLARMAAEPMD